MKGIRSNRREDPGRSRPRRRGSLARAVADEMGEAFEEKEHRLFGKEGFEKIVAEVASLEKELGIYELSRFTPRAPG